MKIIEGKTFDGSEDEAWVIYGDNINSNLGFYIPNVLPQVTNRAEGLSNQFYEFGVDISHGLQMWIGVNSKYIYAIGAEQRDLSLEDGGLANWKAHLVAHPLEVMTYLETPIETDLSDEEIAAYEALHTYSPAATVGNNAEAWMKMGYREWRQ